MVYEKYIKRGGKLYGPYYYKSERKNGKVINSYVNREDVPAQNKTKSIAGIPERTFYITLIVLALVFVGFFLIYNLQLNGKITGFFRFEGTSSSEKFVDSLTRSALENVEFDWTPNEVCEGGSCSLSYVKLSGFIYANKSGSASIYLVDGGKKLRILEKTFELKKVTREEVVAGQETTQEVCHDEQLENETVQSCENVTTPGMESVQNVTTEEPEVYSFDEVCDETCTLSGFDKNSYKIFIELDDGIIAEITSISYQWEKTTEENNAPKVDVVNISSTNLAEVQYGTIKEDPEIQAVVDSIEYNNETNVLTVVFHHASQDNQPVAILSDKNLDYTFDKSSALGNENITLIVNGWTPEDYFEIKIGSHSQIIGIGNIPEYNIDNTVENANGGAVNASVEFEKPVSGEKQELSDGKIEKGEYDINIVPFEGPVKEISINKVNINETIDSLVNLDTNVFVEGYSQVYAIDPTVMPEFTEANVTVTAQGSELYKCKDWNFTEQKCYGEWVKLMDITPGQEYTFTLTAEDPGFGEVITTTDYLFNSSDLQYSPYYELKNQTIGGTIYTSNALNFSLVGIKCTSEKWIKPNMTYGAWYNGTWTFSVYAYCNDANPVAYLFARIFKYNGTEYETVNTTTDDQDICGDTSSPGTLRSWTYVVPFGQNVNLSAGERIGVQICANVTTLRAGKSGFIQWEGTTSSNIIIPTTHWLSDAFSPTIDFTNPTETSGVILNRKNIQVNVTASDTESGIKNITINLYNSTGLRNSTTSLASPYFVNFTNLTNGIYFFNATACDNSGKCNNTEMRNVTVEYYKSPFCNNTSSPCVAPSSLLQCAGNQPSPGPEPNQPNTLDSCTDGVYDTSACHNWGNVENITITDLNGNNFAAGDTISVSAWFFCLDIWDKVSLYYSNSTSSINWVNKSSGTEACSETQYYTYRQHNFTFKLDNVAGTHAIRAEYVYYYNINSSCYNDAYSDKDDVAFKVASDTTPPSISFIPPTTSAGTTSNNYSLSLIEANDANYKNYSYYLYNSTGLTSKDLPVEDMGVSGGYSHTCVLRTNGNVTCYGNNSNGKANNYTQGDAIGVSAGYEHTCVLKTNGNVTCWGWNDDGQANNYTQGDAIGVSVGYVHSCVLKTNGNVNCYGYNGNGQANNYTQGDAIGVSAGGWHNCVLKTNGNVNCYGKNDYGQANNYTQGDAIGVSAGGFHTCVLKANGNVTCWGWNASGQANNYTQGDAIGVSAGYIHTCVLKTNGNVNCYGNNAGGQANNYTQGDAIGVSGGLLYHTCVLKTNGNVNCYGSNSDGQSKNYTQGDAKKQALWAFTNLVNGNYYLNATACDLNNNCNSTETRIVTVNNIIPSVISLVAPANGYSETNTLNVTFTYNVTSDLSITNCTFYLTEPDGYVNAYTNSTITKSINQTFKIPFSYNGQFQWSVNCTDSLNNVSASDTRNITINKVGAQAQGNSNVTKDSYLVENIADTNYGSAVILGVDTETSKHERTVIELNLSNIASGSQINSAILQLYLSSAKNTVTLNVGVYRLTNNWTESGVTWDNRTATAAWTTAGGDYDNTTIFAIVPVNVSATFYQWNITSLVQGWVNGSWPNYGLIMLASGETANNVKSFASSNNGDASRLPVLIINYTAPINVTLNSPADNYYNGTASPASIVFNCSTATANNVFLVNISLYLTNSINQSFGRNQTTNVSGISNSTSWTLNIYNGNYTWNCQACSNGSSCVFGNNRSIVVNLDSTPPAAITSLANKSAGTTWIYWNWTNPSNSDFSQVIIYRDNVNVANTSNNYYNATGLLSGVNYTIRINAKDINGNVNYTNVSSTARTVSIPVTVINESSSNSAGATLNTMLVLVAENGTTVYNNTNLTHTSITLQSGLYTVIVQPVNYSVYQVVMTQVYIGANTSKIVDFDSFNINNTKAFAISPHVNFSSANVTLTASGVELMKCSNWSFATQECLDGNWAYVMDLTAGQNYSFLMNSTDPGFIELTRYGCTAITCWNKAATVACTCAQVGSDDGTLASGGALSGDGGSWAAVLTEHVNSTTPAGKNVTAVNVGINWYIDQLATSTCTLRVYKNTTATWYEFNTTCQTVDTIYNYNLSNWINTTQDAQNVKLLINMTGAAGAPNEKLYVDMINVTLTWADITPPVITLNSPAPGYLTRNTSILFNLSATDNLALNSTCNLTLDSIVNKSNIFIANGSSNVTVVDGISEGYHLWNASCIDDGGNNVGHSEKRNFTIDLTPPFISIISPANTTYNNKTPLVNISTSGASNTWFFNGTANVTYTIPVLVTFAEGSNTLYAYANDSVGNLNSTSVTFVVDTIAPTIDFVPPTETSGTTLPSRNNLQVNVTASDANYANVTINLYNSTGLVNSTFSIQTTYFVNFTNLANGIYYFNATARDSLNNQNSTGTRNVTINYDITPPSISITYPTNITYNVNVSVLNYTVSDANLQACWYSLNSGTTNTTITPCGTNLTGLTSTEGNNTWAVWANDSAGNVNYSSVTFFIYICTPNMTNTTWSDWSNLICSGTQMNQSRFRVEYDSNNCGGMPNQTIYGYQLVGPDYQNTSWGDWYNLSTCYLNGTIEQQRNSTQYDLYRCATNQTFSENRIENCSPDLTPPTLSNISIVPYDPAIGNNVSISASATDVVGISGVFANITLPNGTVVVVSLPANYTIQVDGRHNITIWANDSLGNVATFDDYFIAATSIVNVTFNVINSNLSGVPVNLSIYFAGTDKEVHEHDFTGNLSDEHGSLIFDLYYLIVGENSSVRLNGVNISLYNNSVLGFDRNTSISGYLVVYGVNSTYGFDNATLELSYAGLAFSDEDNLVLEKCNNWDFVARSCTSGFVDITSQAVQNNTGDYFVASVNSFSGFGIKEVTTAPITPTEKKRVGGGYLPNESVPGQEVPEEVPWVPEGEIESALKIVKDSYYWIIFLLVSAEIVLLVVLTRRRRWKKLVRSVKVKFGEEKPVRRRKGAEVLTEKEIRREEALEKREIQERKLASKIVK